MSHNKTFIGSSIAFLIATSCCWLPWLVLFLGGASSVVALSDGLKAFSGLFMGLGLVLLVFGGYQFYNRKKTCLTPNVELNSLLTCPKCQYQKVEKMPTDACQFFYECESCKIILKPLENDCCVYCSYGSVPCPPIQLNIKCC